jgi:hypothetical protein
LSLQEVDVFLLVVHQFLEQIARHVVLEPNGGTLPLPGRSRGLTFPIASRKLEVLC